MKFQLKADIEFEARDLDEALEALEKYFRDVRNEVENNFIDKGEIEIKRVDLATAPLQVPDSKPQKGT